MRIFFLKLKTLKPKFEAIALILCHCAFIMKWKCEVDTRRRKVGDTIVIKEKKRNPKEILRPERDSINLGKVQYTKL